jgi:hypothetical protein
VGRSSDESRSFLTRAGVTVSNPRESRRVVPNVARDLVTEDVADYDFARLNTDLRKMGDLYVTFLDAVRAELNPE